MLILWAIFQSSACPTKRDRPYRHYTYTHSCSVGISPAQPTRFWPSYPDMRYIPRLRSLHPCGPLLDPLFGGLLERNPGDSGVVGHQ